MSEEVELSAAAGFIEPQLSAEFPGLRLDWVTVAARMGPSPRHVQHRLGQLSNRYRGASVVAMRTQPIPHAYRAFFHQVGMDPDASRVPSGHPEGYLEAFAQLYSDIAEQISARNANRAPSKDSLLVPTVDDGVAGVQFIAAVLASSKQNAAWTKLS